MRLLDVRVEGDRVRVITQVRVRLLTHDHVRQLAQALLIAADEAQIEEQKRIDRYVSEKSGRRSRQ